MACDMCKNNCSCRFVVGKWPFKRFLGIQEPASVLFSILNLLANYFFGYKVLRNKLRRSLHPLYTMWLVFCLISMNAWIWSTVFHTRDTTWTEIFDYIAALSLVFSQFACCLIRVSYHTRHRRYTYTAVLLLTGFFLYHAYYLLFIHMDFSYNMKVNIFIGLLNVICWLLWSLINILSSRTYVWPCTLSVTLAMLCASLELIDFPPIASTIDAHSLWHLSTIILPILWYRFVVDDAKYLLTMSKWKGLTAR
jgi:post-GPI attachment to proteins factor 3